MGLYGAPVLMSLEIAVNKAYIGSEGEVECLEFVPPHTLGFGLGGRFPGLESPGCALASEFVVLFTSVAIVRRRSIGACGRSQGGGSSRGGGEKELADADR